MEEDHEVAGILERYRVENSFDTLEDMRRSFNERLNPDGLSRQTFYNWRTGQNSTFNRALLRLVRYLYPVGDWRYDLAGELLALTIPPE